MAILLLVVDAGEYPGVSRPALRAFARGPLPLLLIAALNVRALSGGRTWRLLAVGANLLLVGASSRLLGRGAPPFFWLLAGVAVMLLAASIAALASSRGVGADQGARR